MKLSKLLLTPVLTITPMMAIAPTIVSCNKQVAFEAYTNNKHFTTTETSVIIPLTFSYSPTEPVTIYLEGDTEGLTYPQVIKIKDNRVDLKITITSSLSQSKLFKFDIKFIYDTISSAFVLKDLYLIYQFIPPEKDNIMLRSPSVVETTESKCTFKIQFDKEPTSAGGKIGTELAEITRTTADVPVRWEKTQQIKVEGTKYYLYFEIDTYSSFANVYFFMVFDLILEFKNSYGYDQMEVIPNCTFTHLI